MCICVNDDEQVPKRLMGVEHQDNNLHIFHKSWSHKKVVLLTLSCPENDTKTASGLVPYQQEQNDTHKSQFGTIWSFTQHIT